MPSVSQSGRLSLLRLAWHQLTVERESSAAVAIALLLALLPAGLLLVETSGARADLAAILAASGGVGVQRGGVANPATFDAFQAQTRALVAPRLGQYVDAGSERAAAGPYRLASVGSGPPPPPIDAADVEVRYVNDLASRVVVGQGVLPRSGAASAEGMATMPEVLADRAGIRLFDQVCLRAPSNAPPAATPGQPLWCARIVGIWRPAGGADPAWTARNAPLQLFTAREPYFALVALAPAPEQTEASRLYRPRPAAIAPQDAATVTAGVRDLRTAVDPAHAGQVRSTLDAELTRYAATGDLLSLPVEMLTAALVPLLVLLAWVVARWYVEPRVHDLALLRARGWAPGRVLLLVLAQFAGPAAAALAAALLGVLVLAWRPGLGPLSSTPGELLAAAVAVVVLVVTAGRLVGVARWASSLSVLSLEKPAAEPPLPPAWRGARINSLLVVPATLLLLLSRVAGGERGRLPGVLGDVVTVVVSGAGLAMLVLAALPALSLAAESLSGQRVDLEGTLARWQLRRWWQRHAATGFLVVFAFAVAAFAAVTLADEELNRTALNGVVLGTGVAVSLAIGFLTAMAAAVLAYGLLFLAASRARTHDYAALLVDGLSAAAVRRSLRIEQHIVLGAGLLVGLALGLVLAWTTSWSALVGPPAPAGAALGLLLTAAVGGLAGGGAGWLVRRRTVGFDLVQQGRAT